MNPSAPPDAVVAAVVEPTRAVVEPTGAASVPRLVESGPTWSKTGRVDALGGPAESETCPEREFVPTPAAMASQTTAPEIAIAAETIACLRQEGERVPNLGPTGSTTVGLVAKVAANPSPTGGDSDIPEARPLAEAEDGCDCLCTAAPIDVVLIGVKPECEIESTPETAS